MLVRDRRPGLKAVYDVTELADLMGMSKQGVRDWLSRTGVATVRNGRSILVPLSAIATAFPAIYASLMMVVGARKTDDDASGSLATWPSCKADRP